MARLLEVKNLRVSYNTNKGKIKAVRGVEFHLDENETLAIVGESGCGKTATVKALTRLIESPYGIIEKGSEIFFEGRNVLNMGNKELEKLRGGEIGMIFQDPSSSLDPTMKIGDQIAESLIVHKKFRKKDAKHEACEMLQKMQIADAAVMMDKYPHEFSGGMKQRIMIASALACKPKILIADEPTTALDATVQAQILKLLKKFQQSTGLGLILITHDLSVAAEFADRIHIMYAGRIVEKAKTEELFKNPAHPYTNALLKSIPRFDIKPKSVLYSLKDYPPDSGNSTEGCPFYSRCEYCAEICGKSEPKTAEISESHKASCWKTVNEMGGTAV